jgi:hypothetical protein
MRTSGRDRPIANLEAEQSVLGAIILRPEALDQVADLLTPQDFYREDHRLIYQTMLDLRHREAPVDLVTVTENLKDLGQLEKVGGPVFLASLNEHVGTAANAPYYAKLVWEKAQIRKLRAKANEILTQDPDGNLSEYLTWAESQILEVTQEAHRDLFPPLKGNTQPPISEVIKNPPPPRDYLLENVLPAQIVAGVIAVGGTGKGYFIIMFGLSLATGREIGLLKPSKNFKVVYLSGEDDQKELERRVHATAQLLWPEGPPPEVDNFIPISVRGKLGPLMQLDTAGNPVKAPAYDWLCNTNLTSNIE